MKIRPYTATLLLVLLLLVAVNLPGLSTDAPSQAQAMPTEQRIEIIIRDYEFQLAKPTTIRPGCPPSSSCAIRT